MGAHCQFDGPVSVTGRDHNQVIAPEKKRKGPSQIGVILDQEDDSSGAVACLGSCGCRFHR